MIPLEDIRKAQERLAGSISRTPLFRADDLSERVGANVFVKCESLQKTSSFKARGALNKVLSLPEADRQRGLITVSAGNHALAVAWAAATVGVPATVVMPEGASRFKVDAVRLLGGEIVFHDSNDTLFERVEAERVSRGATFVHPFDDPVVLAGAAGVGVEIVEDLASVDTVVVAVGGGGLMAGMASAVKQLRPDIRVIAVELAAGPGLGPALEAGEPVTVQRPRTVADGMTPPFVGKIPLAVARQCVDRLVTVEESDIIEAMRVLVLFNKLVVEGSGAAACAALLSRQEAVNPASNVVAIVSGGNIDAAVLSRIIGSA